MDKKPSAQPDSVPESFEDSLQRLETVVAQLERTDLTLEDSVRMFEEGMALVSLCRRQLDAAEAKVELLVKRAGGMAPQPFTPGEVEAET
ncbi:MAG: exodeoxyribonuclease VII small subunit [Terriglobales bacterium]